MNNIEIINKSAGLRGLVNYFKEDSCNDFFKFFQDITTT